MNSAKSKMFRKIFKNRRSYRAFKKAYTEASQPKKLEVLRTSRQIIASGKDIHVQ